MQHPCSHAARCCPPYLQKHVHDLIFVEELALGRLAADLIVQVALLAKRRHNHKGSILHSMCVACIIIS